MSFSDNIWNPVGFENAVVAPHLEACRGTFWEIRSSMAGIGFMPGPSKIGWRGKLTQIPGLAGGGQYA